MALHCLQWNQLLAGLWAAELAQAPAPEDVEAGVPALLSVVQPRIDSSSTADASPQQLGTITAGKCVHDV